MKTRSIKLIVASLALSLLILAGARAGSAMLAQPTAVAVVNLDEVLQNLDERTAIETEIRSQAQNLQQEGEQRRQKVAQLKQQLDEFSPGSTGYQQKEKQLTEDLVELKVWQEVEQQSLDRERVAQSEKLYRKIVGTVGSVADEAGYGVVLAQSDPLQLDYSSAQEFFDQVQQRQVIHAGDQVDLTDQIVQRMNNEYEAVR
ncbi:MAG: OmpH family outer membrane protein [Phycisphaeraceae bacterium]